MERTAEQTKAFWDEQARQHGTASLATMPDGLLKGMEIEAIVRRLPEPPARVLDVGCGNGFSTLAFARQRPVEIVGVDYSQDMIQAAERARAEAPPDVRARVGFRSADVLSLPFGDGEFDVVTTDRCLINLVSLEAQRRALAEIQRVLRPGGRYLMCEDTQEGLTNLNELRAIAGLAAIPTRWHNLYLSERELAPTWQALFETVEVDNFSSLYYVASRVFNAFLAARDGQEPRYDHPINQLAARLPSMGESGPLKLFVLRKRA